MSDLKNLMDFISSYKNHSAGIDHELNIIVKGSGAIDSLEHIEKVTPNRAKIYYFRDMGFDLGSYTEFAKHFSLKKMFIINQHSVIKIDRWLYIYESIAEKTGSDVVAGTASFSSLREPYIATRNRISLIRNLVKKIISASKYRAFPGYPNPHIRTNAMLVKTDVWIKYFSTIEFTSKKKCHLAESGPHSFYNYCIKSNTAIAITRSDGEYTVCESEWQDFVPFRNYLQDSLLIIADKQTEFYRKSSQLKKINLCMESWRQLIPS